VSRPLPVDDVMAEVRRRVRARLQDELARTSPGSPLLDDEIMEGVEAIVDRIVAVRRRPSLPGLLLPDEDWRAVTALRFTSHRPVAGGALVFVKRRILLPLMRWLFDYSRDNFERQAVVNEALLASVETLMVEVVTLRRQVVALGAAPPPAARDEAPGP
jgi:hypothetical protein